MNLTPLQHRPDLELPTSFDFPVGWTDPEIWDQIIEQFVNDLLDRARSVSVPITNGRTATPSQR